MARWRTNWVAGDLGLASRHAVHDVLALASEVAPPLRAGLTAQAASEAAIPLLQLLVADAVGITDTYVVLGWAGGPEELRSAVMDHVRDVLNGRDSDVRKIHITASSPGESRPSMNVVVVPLVVDECVVGALAVYVREADLSLVRATGEVARWVSTQVELGELGRARAMAAGAQLKALRAQISPHFLFNALNTIASFVRTDPDRARDLLVEFADFARYSFSTTGQFTSLADELRAIDTYVAIERARFGDRLTVHICVAPEVLGVKVPFLVLQPLVENALQHGLYRKGDRGTLRIDARDNGVEALIVIEDDGVGMDPSQLADTLAGRGDQTSIGLVNVDERMRTVYGNEYGLQIETNLGMGTRITIRVPKSLPGVSVA